MAWEARGGQLYYYRSKREGRKVRKIYLGRGPAARLAAQQDAEAKRRREAERRELLRLRVQMGQLGAVDDLIERGLGVLTTATLYTEGYHEHHGEWRKRRGG